MMLSLRLQLPTLLLSEEEFEFIRALGPGIGIGVGFLQHSLLPVFCPFLTRDVIFAIAILVNTKPPCESESWNRYQCQNPVPNHTGSANSGPPTSTGTTKVHGYTVYSMTRVSPSKYTCTGTEGIPQVALCCAVDWVQVYLPGLVLYKQRHHFEISLSSTPSTAVHFCAFIHSIYI